MPKRKLHAINERTLGEEQEFISESEEFKKRYGNKIDYTYDPSVYGREKLVTALNKLYEDKYKGSLSFQFHNSNSRTYGMSHSEFIDALKSSNIGKADIDTLYLQSCNAGAHSKFCKDIKEAIGNKPVVGQKETHYGFARDDVGRSMKDVLFSAMTPMPREELERRSSEILDKYGYSGFWQSWNKATSLRDKGKISNDTYLKLSDYYNSLILSILEKEDVQRQLSDLYNEKNKLRYKRPTVMEY